MNTRTRQSISRQISLNQPLVSEFVDLSEQLIFILKNKNETCMIVFGRKSDNRLRINFRHRWNKL